MKQNESKGLNNHSFAVAVSMKGGKKNITSNAGVKIDGGNDDEERKKFKLMIFPFLLRGMERMRSRFRVTHRDLLNTSSFPSLSLDLSTDDHHHDPTHQSNMVCALNHHISFNIIMKEEEEEQERGRKRKGPI